MNIGQFNEVVETQFDKCKGLLFVKGNEYALTSDRLEYFKKAAALQNTTSSRALFGMLAKHIVSLAEMCECPIERFDKARWSEKITDSMNYLVLLWALVNDDEEKEEASRGQN